MADSDLLSLTGLWISEPKKEGGKKYLSGRCSDKTLGELAVLMANNPNKELRILCFKNDRKREGRKDPDYNLTCCIDKPKDDKPKEEQKPPPMDDDVAS